MRKGQILRVVDPMGEQVSDLFAFSADDPACALSSGRSIDYASRIYLTTGDVLYANDSRRMFTIVADSVGRHDFLLTPCSQEMFEILYRVQGHHPSCFENLCKAFEPHGIRPDQITTTFNIFMNVLVDPQGTVTVAAAHLACRRLHRTARRDGPDLRPHRLLGRAVEQRELQADRLRGA